MSTLGERIKVLREQKGWSQADLSQETGILQATISRVESGVIPSLKSENILKLAKALNTSADFLVGKIDKMDFEDSLINDPQARYLFRGYEKLNDEEKKMLRNYLDFLSSREKRGDW